MFDTPAGSVRLSPLDLMGRSRVRQRAAGARPTQHHLPELHRLPRLTHQAPLKRFKEESGSPDPLVMRWVVGFIAVVGVGAWPVFRLHRRHDRQRQLMQLCDAADLGFAPLDLSSGTAWLPFGIFGRRPSGTENVIFDPLGDGEVRAFDFWYEESRDGQFGVRRTITCATVPLPFTCSRVRVAPRSVVDDVPDALGLPLVTLELEEFNKRFRVEAEDPRTASALLDQRVMQALLRLPFRIVVDVNEDVLLLRARKLPAVEMLQLLRTAISIQHVLPRVMTSLFPARPAHAPHERRWLQGRWSDEPIGADTAEPSDLP